MRKLFIILGILFIIGLIIFLVLKFSGKTSVSPPNLNKSDGSADVTTADAIADFTADKTTGEFLASAAVDGFGKGVGTATLGHEFEYTGSKHRTLEVIITFEFNTRVEITDGPAHVSAIINAILPPNSSNVADDRLDDIGLVENPSRGGRTLTSRTFNITVDPGDKFEVVIYAKALAKSTDENDPASCSASVSGRIVIISVTPL